MRQTDTLLDPGEPLICRARVHWWFNLRSFGLRNLFQQALVTDRRVILRQGILSTVVRSQALGQIESLELVQPLLGRILGFGDLEIHGSGGQMLQLQGICAPQDIARAIGRGRSASAERGA